MCFYFTQQYLDLIHRKLLLKSVAFFAWKDLPRRWAARVSWVSMSQSTTETRSRPYLVLILLITFTLFRSLAALENNTTFSKMPGFFEFDTASFTNTCPIVNAQLTSSKVRITSCILRRSWHAGFRLAMPNRS